MGPLVTFSTPDGRRVSLGHGELIGRLASASLHVDDARVSEAHAMVSLRGGELKLLALRGRFALDGKPRNELVLAPGQSIELARGLALVVDEVLLPQRVLAIQGPGLARQTLTGVCSLVAGTHPRLVPRYQGEALAWFWSTGEGWRLRLANGEVRDLQAGESLDLRGNTYEIVELELERAGNARTRAVGAVTVPLTIVAYFDTVHLLREGHPSFALVGRQARLISELVACGAPVSWLPVARQLWPDESDQHALRRRWDVTLSRLRGKLKQAGLRSDLVNADGKGNFELLLYDGDKVDDKT